MLNDEAPPDRGPVVAIGGAEDRIGQRGILRHVLELAGGPRARMVVIPTASRLRHAGQGYARLFEDFGAASVRVLPLHDRNDCCDPEQIAAIEHATGIFMTGGNQLRLSSVIGGTAIAKAIRLRSAAGALVAGTSAGAAVLSEHMIAYGQEGATPRAGMVSVVPGLGLVHEAIIDQHFRQRDRLGRLLTALAYNPFAVGVGLDEDTAVVFERDGWARVIGSNAVTVVDASGVSHTELGYVRAGEPISLLGLRLHVLVDGAGFHLHTREARPAWHDAEEDAERLAAADRDVEGLPPGAEQMEREP